jgi:intergrase/recombinase
LEHFRFREIFIRSTKKAYVSFCPLELLEKIGAKEPFQRSYSIQKALARRHVSQRFSDIREANGTFLVKYLKEIEIDTLQGRISSSVFKIHYWNMKLVADLRSRVAQAAKEILAKIALNPEIEAKNLGRL